VDECKPLPEGMGRLGSLMASKSRSYQSLMVCVYPKRTVRIRVRVHSLNHFPSQVRTLVVPEVLGSVRGHSRRFWAVLFNFGRF